MNKILDDEKDKHKIFSLNKHNITPFFVISSILRLISIIAVVVVLFNALIGKGGKGTITVVIIVILVFGITEMVLLLERGIVTKENKRSVIIGEILIIFMVLIGLFSSGLH